MFGFALWLIALFFLGSLIIYFIPTFIAGFRNHPQFQSIALINLFLGWTAIGWFATLIWSVLPARKLTVLRADRDGDMITVN